MGITTFHDSILGQHFDPAPPLGPIQPYWYVAHIAPRSEKRVAERMKEREIECFLPLYAAVHRWADRWKNVELPLFPGYVFVRIEQTRRLPVLQIPGVVGFITFGERLATLPDLEVDTLRQGLSLGGRAEPHPFLKVGRRVRIKRGPFQGAEGVLARVKSLIRVVISMELIMRSVAVEVSTADIELL